MNRNCNDCPTAFSGILDTSGETGPRHLDGRARETLGQYVIELLATIVLPEPPQSLAEVDARLADGLLNIPSRMLPTEADMESYRALAEKGRKKLLNLPMEKIYAAIKVRNLRFD